MTNPKVRIAKQKIRSSPLLRLLLGLAISALTLYFALRNVHFQDFWKTFLQSEPLFMGLALVSVITNILIKIARWKALLESKGQKAGLFKVSTSFLAAQLLNAFLPVRAGEISRIYIFGRTGVEQAFVLGTIAVEKTLDMIAFALLFVLLLILIPLPDWIGATGFTLVFAVFFISLMVFIATFYRDRLISVVARAIGCFPERLTTHIFSYLRIGLSSLDILQSRSDLVKLAVETALIWGTALLTNQLVSLALAIDLPLSASLLVLIALLAGISIPSLPAKVGILEFICVLALGVFGVDQALALSYGILLHVIIYLPIVISGLFTFWILGMDWTKERTASILQ